MVHGRRRYYTILSSQNGSIHAGLFALYKKSTLTGVCFTRSIVPRFRRVGLSREIRSCATNFVIWSTL